MWDYTDDVMDHFLKPRNVGYIEDADGVGEVGSLSCGDALTLTFKLGDDGRIADAKFKTFGCASAVASSSVLTELIKGMTLEEAEKVTNDDIVDKLGGLPDQKLHCSVMGQEALEAAIANYRNKGKEVVVKEGNIICTCFGVTEEEIRKVVGEHGLTKAEQVTNFCKAGGGCGGCIGQIEKIIEDVQGEKAEVEHVTAPVRPAKMTNIQKQAKKCSDCAVWPKLESQGILKNPYGYHFEHRRCPRSEPWTSQQRHEQLDACPNYVDELRAIAEGEG